MEAAEVSAWLPAAILLLHQVERTAPLAVGPPDDTTRSQAAKISLAECSLSESST